MLRNGQVAPSRNSPDKSTSNVHSASRALSDSKIINDVLAHLEEDFLLLGRERRQALIAGLALTSKAWLDAVNKTIYRYAAAR